MAEKKERTVVKKVPNAVAYSDGTILIQNVRCSFPHLAKPYGGKNDNGEESAKKFGIILLLPKSSHTQAKDLVKSIIMDIQKTNETKVATEKWFLKDGDQSDREENEGMFTISTREGRRPSVRDRSGAQMAPDEIENKFYGGCWVNALIRPWYQDGVKIGAGYGKRINAAIVAVQFVKDDEPFGEGRIDDTGVFESIDGDDGFDNEDDDSGL